MDLRKYSISALLFLVYLVGTTVAIICGGAAGTNIGWLVRSQMEEVHNATLIVCPIVIVVLYFLHKLISAKFAGKYRRSQLAGEYSGVFLIIVCFIYLSNT